MRRRYVYDEQQKKMVEIEKAPKREDAPLILGDIEPFVSTVDGSIISSRSHLREHMKQHGLAHTSDYDKPGGYWDKARKARADWLSGKSNPDSSHRKQQLSDSFEHLRNQQRAKHGR